MDRQEMINYIRTLVGSKMEIHSKYYTRIAIGEDRPVVSITKKYVYLGSECFIRRKFDNGTEVHEIQRLPLCRRFYRFDEWDDCKVELDKLTDHDLETLYEGVKAYFEWQIKQIPEKAKELENLMRAKIKYNKVMGLK